MKKAILGLAMITSAALCHAQSGSSMPTVCPKARSTEEILNDPSCGNTPACAAKRDAELRAAQAAHECEMAKLAAAAASPVPGAATAAAVTK